MKKTNLIKGCLINNSHLHQNRLQVDGNLAHKHFFSRVLCAKIYIVIVQYCLLKIILGLYILSSLPMATAVLLQVSRSM